MHRPAIVAIAVGLLATGAAAFLYVKQAQPTPTCVVASAPAWLGHATSELVVTVEVPSGALGEVAARITQGERALPLALAPVAEGGALPEGPPAVRRFSAPLDAGDLALVEGPAEIAVFATDDAWRPKARAGAPVTHALRVDLTPPTVELVSFTTYVKHAGSACVVFRASGARRAGVEAGGAFFPGHAGLRADPGLHVALATFPHSMPRAAPSLVAVDEAGNRRVVSIPVTFLPAEFQRDEVTLTEAFLRRKVPEVDPQAPGDATTADLLQRYLSLNTERRAEDERILHEKASASTDPRILWSGAFRQQPNTKVLAGFPERRTYSWEGKVVDEQWHLGLDLASSRRSPVLASNAGRVSFTGAVGIYGNVVLVDHGLGLTSLYAHLSEIGVTEGQAVERGDALGRSGETGFAAGDHLHFAMLVGGIPANPVEWWDAAWIRDRVGRPLAEAGIAVPGVTDLAAEPAPRGRRGRNVKAAPAPRRGGKRRT